MKRKLTVVECDLCGQQQVDNGDVTEILGVTIRSGFYASHAGGGPLPKDTFICTDCVQGTATRGPVLMRILVALVFNQVEDIDLPNYFTPPEAE